MVLSAVTLEPNNVCSPTIGRFYMRNDLSGLPTALGKGNNQVTSAIFLRLNENWGLRATHHFDVRNSRLQEQYYSVYRDLRSWTAAVTVGLRENNDSPSQDFTVAFPFSLKAIPRFNLGSDTVRPYSMLGQ